MTSRSAASLPVSAGLPALVLTRYLSTSVADTLRTLAVDSADEAGNMRLDLGDALIDIQGRRRPQSSGAPRVGLSAAFRPAGLRVVFALLTWENLADAPYRTIGAVAGTALGTTNYVMDDLERSGFLQVTTGRRRLVRTSMLLDRWVELFNLSIAPTLDLGRFASSAPGWWRDDLDGIRTSDVLIGGETAADQMGTQLSTKIAVLYAPQVPAALAARHRWRKADATTPSADVEVRRRFWTPRVGGGGLVAPSTLVYADLLGSGDPRQRQAADELRTTDDLLVRLDRS
ncbi:type IV toxin-antitoxin system AbiEi family antitoxin [Oerskovia jenensis]|uniref:type IV toxin-antitoxin system AbiEi family antitoxin n=1 Tax=Oerskovia jenensis TaxID=162169 RepID=UPI0036DDA593